MASSDLGFLTVHQLIPRRTTSGPYLPEKLPRQAREGVGGRNIKRPLASLQRNIHPIYDVSVRQLCSSPPHAFLRRSTMFGRLFDVPILTTETLDTAKRTAAATGQPVLLRQWNQECDEPDCSLDNMSEWMMPDGKRKIVRNHTY